MRKLGLFLIASTIALTIYSCADKVISNPQAIEDNSFEAWVKINEPSAIAFPSGDGYYKITKAKTKSSTKVEENDWVDITYTGKMLNGIYFKNFFRDIAYQLGTYSGTTHFIPFFTRYDSTNVQNLPKGMYQGLAMMEVGDSISLFLTSKMAYGEKGLTITSNGFQGELSQLTPYTPVNFNLKFNSIVKDPKELEKTLVQDYAVNELKLASYDSLKMSLYMKTVIANPTGSIIGADSIVHLDYKGYFMDDFVFDTNIELVAKNNNIYNKSTEYKPYRFQASGADGTIDKSIEAFNKCIPLMRKGESAIVVLSSDWGYGATGNGGSAGSTTIYPYTPLVFSIYVLTDEEYKKRTEND